MRSFSVRGLVVNGVNAYMGIPFAATTGGQNRWKPPQPAGTGHYKAKCDFWDGLPIPPRRAQDLCRNS
jgi:carboxylesterase type B